MLVPSSRIQISSNYLPYGPTFGQNGSEAFMYTGKPFDSLTGFYYYNARLYDPTIGRFLTEDTYTGSESDPLSLNRYIYARDHPEKYNDPNGHMFTTGLGDGVSTSDNCGWLGCQSNAESGGGPNTGSVTSSSSSTSSSTTVTNTITTSSGSTGTSSTSSITLGSFFLNDWLPSHEAEFALDILGIGLSAAGLSLVFAQITELDQAALSSILDAIGLGLDTGPLAVAIANNDISGIVESAASIAIDGLSTVIDSLSWIQKIQLGASAAVEETSNGVDLGASEALSLASAGVTAGELYYNVWSGWNAYESGS